MKEKQKVKSEALLKEKKRIQSFMKGTNDRKTKSRNRLKVEKGPNKIREEQKAFECQSRKRKKKLIL